MSIKGTKRVSSVSKNQCYTTKKTYVLRFNELNRAPIIAEEIQMELAIGIDLITPLSPNQIHAGAASNKKNGTNHSISALLISIFFTCSITATNQLNESN